MLQLQMTQQREDHARAIREATARHSAESAALQAQLVCACPRLPFLSTQQTTSSQETTRTELQRARTEAARAREEGAAAQAELSTLRQSTERLTAELAQTKETLRTAEARLHAVEPLDVHSDAALAAWDVPLDPATADPTAVKRTEPLRAQCVAYQQLIAAVAASAPVVAPSEVQEAPKQQQEEEQKVVPQTHTQAQTQTRHWDDAAEAALLEACRVHGVAVSEVCPPCFLFIFVVVLFKRIQTGHQNDWSCSRALARFAGTVRGCCCAGGTCGTCGRRACTGSAAGRSSRTRTGCTGARTGSRRGTSTRRGARRPRRRAHALRGPAGGAHRVRRGAQGPGRRARRAPHGRARVRGPVRDVPRLEQRPVPPLARRRRRQGLFPRQPSHMHLQALGRMILSFSRSVGVCVSLSMRCGCCSCDCLKMMIGGLG